MDDLSYWVARAVPSLPFFGACGLGMIAAVVHLALGRSALPAVLLLAGLFGVAAVHSVWMGLDAAMTLMEPDAMIAWYDSWASTALDVGLIAADAVFLAILLSAPFAGRLGVAR